MDLPDARRFELRLALESAGAEVSGYNDGFTLAIKRGCFCAVDDKAKELGLVLDGNSLNYFPLGSDNPPEEFRHWVHPYTAERGHGPGFWLYATYRLP